MNVYICFRDHEMKAVFETEEDAIKWSIVNTNGNISYISTEIQSFDLSVWKDKLFEYFIVTYKPWNTKQTVESVCRTLGVYEDDVKFNQITLNRYGWYNYCVKAANMNDALEKFYEDYKNTVNKYYIENGVNRTNGGIKEWQNHDDINAIEFIDYIAKLKGTQK